MNLYNTPGLRYVGTVSNPHINNGEALPHFEPVSPKGHPGINTLEGWNAKAKCINIRSFVYEFGREPTDKSELDSWVYGLCE